ncbi:MAG: hypothetical protein AB8H12_24855, partial [Lewinella sp.]
MKLFKRSLLRTPLERADIAEHLFPSPSTLGEVVVVPRNPDDMRTFTQQLPDTGGFIFRMLLACFLV